MIFCMLLCDFGQSQGLDLIARILVQSLTYQIQPLLFQRARKVKKISYEEFIKVIHITFLTMWLCKYLFYNVSFRVTMEYRQLAITLASGKKIEAIQI
ncbi:hypothetical protein H5410_026090 [Solanum commersonii]|uniref:Uncharacterized protein n=1 Tax=Solanum commersonii TaxID=4109 RepID=A0A9J5Z0G3_SOLCO|nr:hypothetical protein H5410_026090 [Solanum commersonii]